MLLAVHAEAEDGAAVTEDPEALLQAEVRRLETMVTPYIGIDPALVLHRLHAARARLRRVSWREGRTATRSESRSHATRVQGASGSCFQLGQEIVTFYVIVDDMHSAQEYITVVSITPRPWKPRWRTCEAAKEVAALVVGRVVGWWQSK